MKDRHLALRLKLDEGIQDTVFDIHVHESLPKVNSVLVKMQGSPIQVNQNSDDSAYLEGFLLGLPRHTFEVVVRSPSFLVEFVARGAIDAPNIILPRQILVD